ncbi:MAG: hypothetical protein QXV17_14125 [Candidatus Micrarchaeaceae archaeon]
MPNNFTKISGPSILPAITFNQPTPNTPFGTDFEMYVTNTSNISNPSLSINNDSQIINQSGTSLYQSAPSSSTGTYNWTLTIPGLSPIIVGSTLVTSPINISIT